MHVITNLTNEFEVIIDNVHNKLCYSNAENYNLQMKKCDIFSYFHSKDRLYSLEPTIYILEQK